MVLKPFTAYHARSARDESLNRKNNLHAKHKKQKLYSIATKKVV